MRILRKTLLILSLLAVSVNPLLTQANTAVMNGWELTQTTRVGTTTTYVGYKQTPAGTFRSTASIIPPAGTIAKFIGRISIVTAVVGLAIEGLFGAAKWFFDPANHRVIVYQKTGLWTDPAKEFSGDLEAVARYVCNKRPAWKKRTGTGLEVGSYEQGWGLVRCELTLDRIIVHEKEHKIPYTQIAEQILRDARAGKPKAVEAVGQVADQMAKPAWMVATWERNKQLVEEKISPEAIALTQAHASGKKIGGNCTPGEHRELEDGKQRHCSGNGKISCEENNLSITELRRRAHLAERCAYYRTRINQKCFAGGDANHRNEARKVWNVYGNCTDKISKFPRK